VSADGARRDTGGVLEKFNPPGVHEPAGYSHVTISSAGRLAHLAGQCPLDLGGSVVGAPGDYDAQTDQVVANCLAVLAAAGATPADVVRSIIYVVSPDSDVLAGVWWRLAASPLAPAFTTASTLLGVSALGYRGQLIEVDLTAALPG
jgi:enamine deaminase RidA (YjgF/YER057c/UK114 family)